jgi:hypothetical protein
MVKIRFLALILSICLLVACAPSAQAIQTAIAKTQAAYTPTPTLVPTPTINPCSARGWADIATYVNQFGITWSSDPVGISTSTFLLQLKNLENKINAVSIDACTEHARQLVIGGLDNIIYGLQLIFDDPNDSQAHDVMVKGVTMIDDTNVELSDLGIDITLSLKCPLYNLGSSSYSV